MIIIIILIIIIIKIPGQFIKRRKWWFGPHHIKGALNDDGQRVQLARPELPAPHYICMYMQQPTTLYRRLCIITPDFSPIPIYQPHNDGVVRI